MNFKIISIACGSEHTLALNDQGQVLSWGLNICGQLGQGDFENI